MELIKVADLDSDDKEKTYHTHVHGDTRHFIEANNHFNTIALAALATDQGKYGKDYNDFCHLASLKEHQNLHTAVLGTKLDNEDELNDVSPRIDVPKSFQEMCRIAGKQMHTYGAAVDGCTKTLAVLVDAINENFSSLDETEKVNLGLMGKDKITHFDLLEIGLYGRVNNDPAISLSEIFLRNQNLIEIYSEKHLPSGHGARDHSFPDEFVRRLNSPMGRDSLPQEHLYGPIVISGEKKQIGIVLADRGSDQIFIEKITAALIKYEDGFGFFHPKSRQSVDSKNLCAALHTALDGTTDKVSAVAIALAENKLSDGRLSNILKEAGFLDQKNNSTIPCARAQVQAVTRFES